MYKIVHDTYDGYGGGYFYVYQKFLWWWTQLMEGHSGSKNVIEIKFKTQIDAEEYINKLIRQKADNVAYEKKLNAKNRFKTIKIIK